MLHQVPQIEVGSYRFEGPYRSLAPIDNSGGVYVILDQHEGMNIVLDVGESARLKERLGTHDRNESWSKEVQGDLAVAVMYTPGWQREHRRFVEVELRDEFKPPCWEFYGIECLTNSTAIVRRLQQQRALLLRVDQ